MRNLHYCSWNISHSINETKKDEQKLLIRNLPKETRLGISVYILNKDSSIKEELGSGQIPIFDEKDER